MAGMAMEPTAEKPVRNLPASIHLRSTAQDHKHGMCYILSGKGRWCESNCCCCSCGGSCLKAPQQSCCPCLPQRCGPMSACAGCVCRCGPHCAALVTHAHAVLPPLHCSLSAIPYACTQMCTAVLAAASLLASDSTSSINML
jgi:hypothetical protein